MRRFLLICLLVSILMISLVSVNYAKEVTYELKLGTKMPENNPESIGVLRFCELVEEKSGGRIKIIPYFHEALGNAMTQIENVMIGTQDLFFDSYVSYEHWIPEFKVHSIPYLLIDNEEYRQFLLSDIEKEFEEKLLEKTGLKILNTKRNWIRGPYRVIASKKPILSPDDCIGIKLRQSGSGADVKAWASFGAQINTINWSETYLALKQGIVNAVTSPISLLYSMKFTEVCKHVTKTNEFCAQLCFVMDNKKFESMPEDLQKILIEAIDEAGDYETEVVNKDALVGIKKMKEEHGAIFYDVDTTPFQEKAKSLYPTLEKEGDVPVGLIARVVEWKKSR